MRSWISTFVLHILLLVGPGQAAAQGREEARAAFDEAQRQYDAGNHQLALEGFLRVRDLLSDNQNGQILIGYNIARCLDRLERQAEALREYEQYLANAPSDAPFRTETLDRVRELRGRVEAEASEPAPASSPRGGSVLLPAGVAVASVGAAVLLAAIPTGVVALDRESQLDSTCPNGLCTGSAQGLLDEAYLLGTLTDVFWIAGLSVAAIGAVMIAVGIVNESSDSAPAAGAACTEEGCVATVRAWF